MRTRTKSMFPHNPNPPKCIHNLLEKTRLILQPKQGIRAPISLAHIIHEHRATSPIPTFRHPVPVLKRRASIPLLVRIKVVQRQRDILGYYLLRRSSGRRSKGVREHRRILIFERREAGEVVVQVDIVVVLEIDSHGRAIRIIPHIRQNTELAQHGRIERAGGARQPCEKKRQREGKHGSRVLHPRIRNSFSLFAFFA